jgi:hypothetical protein
MYSKWTKENLDAYLTFVDVIIDQRDEPGEILSLPGLHRCMRRGTGNFFFQRKRRWRRHCLQLEVLRCSCDLSKSPFITNCQVPSTCCSSIGCSRTDLKSKQ